MISPKKVLVSANLFPKKQLGQNFLHDPSVSESIIHKSNISTQDIVLEIGSGLGALTIPASKKAKKIFAVEKDHELISILKDHLKKFHISNVDLIENDILKLDIQEIYQKAGKKIVVIGNLPYYISSQILIQLIEYRKYIQRAILMFQKELVNRLTASPGSKDYGRISVMLQYCSSIQTIASIHAGLFYPIPQVDSAVVEIVFHDTPYQPTEEYFLFKVIKAAFGNRRKTLKNALMRSEFHLDASIAEKSLIGAGIDPVRRAETLTVKEFVELSKQIYDRTYGTERTYGTTDRWF